MASSAARAAANHGRGMSLPASSSPLGAAAVVDDDDVLGAVVGGTASVVDDPVVEVVGSDVVGSDVVVVVLLGFVVDVLDSALVGEDDEETLSSLAPSLSPRTNE